MTQSAKRPVKHLRWYIAILLCLASELNYLDRQTLSVLADTIQRELHLSTVQYSYITTSFLVSYTVMYAVSGRLVDLLGTRRSFMIFVSGWSIANMLHALARPALQFSFFRFLLGATEPANFPGGLAGAPADRRVGKDSRHSGCSARALRDGTELTAAPVLGHITHQCLIIRNQRQKEKNNAINLVGCYIDARWFHASRAGASRLAVSRRLEGTAGGDARDTGSCRQPGSVSGTLRPRQRRDQEEPSRSAERRPVLHLG